MSKVIQVKNLKKVFLSSKKGMAPITAIENINLEVDAREFVAIVGPSGCGKTTFLKLVGGLLEPTSGEILIKGDSVKHARLNKEFGFVFQKPVLLPWRTVMDNICLPLEIIKKGCDKLDSIAHIKKLLDLVGLLDFKDSHPHELSGGMQQRVAIARALIFEPPLLLMDEPFGAIDEITRDFMNLELLRIWQSLKPTVLFVTHCINEAVFLADKVVVLSERPAKVKHVFNITLPRPRCLALKYTTEYGQIAKAVRDTI